MENDHLAYSRSLRDAYYSAYEEAVNRHRTMSTIPSNRTVVEGVASRTTTRAGQLAQGDTTHDSPWSLSSIATNVESSFWRYVVLPGLIIGLVFLIYQFTQQDWFDELMRRMQRPLLPFYDDLMGRLQGWLDGFYDGVVAPASNSAIGVMHSFLHLGRGIKEVCSRTPATFNDGRAWIHRKYNELQPYRDTARQRCQAVAYTIRSNILKVLFISVVLYTGFMTIYRLWNPLPDRWQEWSERPKHYKEPVPRMLRQSRKTQGSNSHYGVDEWPAEPIGAEKQIDAINVDPSPLGVFVEKLQKPLSTQMTSLETEFRTIHNEYKPLPPSAISERKRKWPDRWTDGLNIERASTDSSLEITKKSPSIDMTPSGTKATSMREETSTPPTSSSYERNREWQKGPDGRYIEPSLKELRDRYYEDYARLQQPTPKQRYVGEDLVYCMECKQWHCCYLPY